MVDRSCRLLGHRLDLRSNLGCGSRFTVTAASTPLRPATPALTPAEDMFHAGDVHGARIWLIEDNLLGGQALQGLLQSWGCRASLFESEAQAHDAIQRGEVPDFIISDFRLRNKQNGIGTVLALRERLQTNVPACLITGDMEEDAMADTLAGKPSEAFDALSQLEERRAGDADFDLALGIAANRIKKFNRAIFALERVLLVQPQNKQASLELARALYAVGQGAQAREVLNRAREEGAPVEVSSTMDQFLQSLDKVDARGKRNFKAYLEGAIGVDTNVNGAPEEDSVAVPAFGGSVVALNADGLKTRSNFATVRAGISNRYALNSEWSLMGRAQANLRANDTNANQFDTRSYAVLGGVAYRHEKSEFNLGWQA
eukprot:gene20350-20262_t